MILGVDEVGRGAWAGPLVVGAVVLGDTQIEDLTDSKLLSKKRREELSEIIIRQAAGYGLGWVSAVEIDEIGLAAALRLATIRAVSEIKSPYHEIVIDGTVNFLKETAKGKFVTLMKKADLLVPSVSAASIIAKVARDNFMTALDEQYPHYGFSRHVGYGTAFHRQAIETHGATDMHRYSFSPLTSLRPVQQTNGLTTKVVSDAAETAVATYLKQHGHQILERNWRNKFCEIDIISKCDDWLFFTEVKYRKSAEQGEGLAAITTKKLKQMAFASELYVVSKGLTMQNRQLAAASVDQDYHVISWLKID